MLLSPFFIRELRGGCLLVGVDDVGGEEGRYVGVAGEVGESKPDYKEYDEEYGADSHPYRGAAFAVGG